MLRNCKSCGQLFLSEETSLCKNCLDEAYDVVRSYLESTPGAGISDLILDTGLSLSTINSILSDGRVQIK